MSGEGNNQISTQQALSVSSLMESLLFVADEPVPIDHMASVLEISPEQAEQALHELAQEYVHRGIRIQQKRKKAQMVTAPEAADYVRRFLGLEVGGSLSPAALETLAIIAYRQPTTRAHIESVRGVNSDSVLRTLINRGLVEEQGRLDQVGRPIIYGTTFEFLQQFGLSTLDQLPSLESSPGAE